MSAYDKVYNIPLEEVLDRFRVWADEFGDYVDMGEGQWNVTRMYMALQSTTYANMFLKDFFHPEVVAEWVTWLERHCGYSNWNVQAFYISLMRCVDFPVLISNEIDMLDAMDYDCTETEDDEM